MNSVEPLVLLLAPASLSPSPVILCARRAVSVTVVLSSMVTSAFHQHLVDAIIKDAITKVVSSSGMVKNVRACVPVTALQGTSTVLPTPVGPRSPAVWWRASLAAIPTFMAPALLLETLTTSPLIVRPMTSKEPAAMFW